MTSKNLSIRQLALASGLTEYRITKALKTGEMTAATIEEAQRYARISTPMPPRMTPQEALFFLGGDSERLTELEHIGAVMRDADGKYHTEDLRDPKAHKFAKLPPHPAYTPCRPAMAARMRWKPHTETRRAQFERAYTTKLTLCPWLTRDDYGFYVPDGCYDGRYPMTTVSTFTHKTERFHVVGFSTKQQTVVNIRFEDTQGGTLYTHGVFMRMNTYAMAMTRALARLGFNPAPTFNDPTDAVMWLQDWLNQ